MEQPETDDGSLTILDDESSDDGRPPAPRRRHFSMECLHHLEVTIRMILSTLLDLRLRCLLYEDLV